MFRHDISHRFRLYEHHKTPYASKVPQKLEKAENFFEGQIKGQILIFDFFENFYDFEIEWK